MALSPAWVGWEQRNSRGAGQASVWRQRRGTVTGTSVPRAGDGQVGYTVVRGRPPREAAASGQHRNATASGEAAQNPRFSELSRSAALMEKVITSDRMPRQTELRLEPQGDTRAGRRLRQQEATRLCRSPVVRTGAARRAAQSHEGNILKWLTSGHQWKVDTNAVPLTHFLVADVTASQSREGPQRSRNTNISSVSVMSP